MIGDSGIKRANNKRSYKESEGIVLKKTPRWVETFEVNSHLPNPPEQQQQRSRANGTMKK
ncbi:unnamed protein product [Trichogramma brassicae]|uniref:Uncharacterized protein n=1 Tax=Trichogramma brassicae TaxID=86971 RepID=A0A6H5J3V9_9HYME|nr:unnamed protein product [Trichogramma brassicae]